MRMLGDIVYIVGLSKRNCSNNEELYYEFTKTKVDIIYIMKQALCLWTPCRNGMSNGTGMLESHVKIEIALN